MGDKVEFHDFNSFWRKEALSLLFLSLGIIYASLDFTSSLTIVAFVLVLSKLSKMPKMIDGECSLLFSLFFVVFITRLLYYNDSILWISFFCLTPIFMYGLGRYYTNRWCDNEFLCVLFLLTFTLAVINIYLTIRNISMYGLINPLRTLDSISESMDRPTTQRAIELSLCCFGFTLLFYPSEDGVQKKVKILFVVLAFLASLCFVHYVSRTGLVLILVSILIGIIFRGKRRLSVGTVLIVLILGVVIYVYCFSFLGNIWELYQERELAEGNSYATAGGRLDRWEVAFHELLVYPFGHKTENYAHNLWLGIGQSYGIMPFLFFVFFSISNILKSINIIKRHNIIPLVRLCVAGFTTIFFLSNFTECIHNGNAIYMFIYFMYCGMVSSIYSNIKKYETSISKQCISKRN